ncbi:hypothetical protein [Sphingomonas sp.]|uniref:hypothetical protein n=1 Tax=Sphingomonas sp. TaxID=28214 RepID=UPI0035BBF209
MILLLLTAGAFLVTLMVVEFTWVHPMLIGLALPIGAGIVLLTIFRLTSNPPGNSTAGVAIVIVPIAVALGSIPAGTIASVRQWWKRRSG